MISDTYGVDGDDLTEDILLLYIRSLLFVNWLDAAKNN